MKDRSGNAATKLILWVSFCEFIKLALGLLELGLVMKIQDKFCTTNNLLNAISDDGDAFGYSREGAEDSLGLGALVNVVGLE